MSLTLTRITHTHTHTLSLSLSLSRRHARARAHIHTANLQTHVQMTEAKGQSLSGKSARDKRISVQMTKAKEQISE